MKEQYTVLPEFYDKLNSEADYKGYVEYLKKHLKPLSDIIDLGCGTGDISILLSKQGHTVTALDMSNEMLSEAQAKAIKNNSNVFFTCQNMTSFKVLHLHDAAISCFDSLNYVLTKNELLSVFKCTYNSLKDNGLFIFDMNAPAKFENLYSSNTFVLEEDNVFCVWENEYNKRSRRCKFYINIFVYNGKNYNRYYEEQTERSYKLSEITDALRETGFELLSVSSDFDESPVNNDTQRYYFIARKI